MKRLLIGLALGVMAAATHAEWGYVVKNTNEDFFYFDIATIKRTGSNVRVWGLTDRAKPAVFNGRAYYSTRIYWQYDCVERTAQDIQITSFTGKMATGDIVSSFNQLGNKQFPAPGTADEVLLNYACK